MSRIKDLLAEEENIDDLKAPTRFGKEFSRFITTADNKRIAEAVLRSARTPQVEDYIADHAYFGLGDDDGHPCMFLENFTTLCDEIAVDVLEDLIKQEHLDLSDLEYAQIVEHASNLIADYYADYEDALCLDAFADYERGSKYANDELRERNGQC